MGLTKQYLRYATYGIFNLICGHKSNILFVERNKRRLCVVGACENVIIWDIRKGEKDEVVGQGRMGLTKQYLRYATYGIFNLICGHKSNILFVERNKRRLCVVGACENVIIWDIRKGEKAATLYGEKHEVTRIARSPDGHHLAVGYTDGTVKVYHMGTGDVAITFSGHKSAVSALSYDKQGMRLVSGAKDTEVIVWDIVNESGLFRLKGHKGIVTQAKFLSTKNILVTSSKDTFVKFWDLDTQHCFKTLVSHRTEVWDFVVTSGDSLLITGSADSELRVWRLTEPGIHQEKDGVPKKRQKLESGDPSVDLDLTDEEDTDELDLLTCVKIGSLKRHGRDRVYSMGLDPSGRMLCCHGNENQMEMFRINSEEEVKKHLHKRQKKARKRARESGEGGEGGVPELSLEDEVKRLGMVKLSSKIRAFDSIVEQDASVKLLCLLNNSSLENVSVEISDKKVEVSSSSKLTMPAHRSDVRTTCFSSDNTAILSASGEAVKIWNRATLQCIRTMACDYALCSLFAPGDRHIVVGTKSGKLQIFDIASGALLESIDAHTGAVWSICMAPDKRSVVSGSADHNVKFWEFELVSDEQSSSKRLSLVHTRTLQMSEDVLCVKLSPDNRTLAVALLDNTVKVFFADTLKFFLSLYGHKLPVLCMDISTDGSLLVTGSADRNCKLWGLDFGDCHKSIFAHDDSIMCVQFVPKTHMFLTGSKDGKVKRWDGDSFDHIQTLEGHHAEVWSLSVSPSGNFVVSASHDKSLRLWEKTQEPLILDEEQEMTRERDYEEGAVAQGDQPQVAGEVAGETGVAGKKTVETVRAAEKIMEALELYKEETAKINDHRSKCETTGKELPPPALHPMFQAFRVISPSHYMLEVIRKVKSSELEESLLVLPFSYVGQLLEILHSFINRDWETELSCRCLMFLLRIHQGQITSNEMLLPVIDKLRISSREKVTALKDTIGFNLAALRFLNQQIEEKESVHLFADATGAFKQKKKKQKKRAILAIKT